MTKNKRTSLDCSLHSTTEVRRLVVEAGEDEPEQEGLLTPHLNRREVIAASATVVILDLEVARAALIKGGLPAKHSV